MCEISDGNVKGGGLSEHIIFYEGKVSDAYMGSTLLIGCLPGETLLATHMWDPIREKSGQSPERG